MIKLALLKIIRFIYRIICKFTYVLIPYISKILKLLKLNSRIINQLNKIQHNSHRSQNFTKIISKLLNNKKLLALDVGAQGGFLNGSIFSKIYNIFFDPIVVEPILDEAEKLKKKIIKLLQKVYGVLIAKKNYIF